MSAADEEILRLKIQTEVEASAPPGAFPFSFDSCVPALESRRFTGGKIHEPIGVPINGAWSTDKIVGGVNTAKVTVGSRKGARSSGHVTGAFGLKSHRQPKSKASVAIEAIVKGKILVNRPAGKARAVSNGSINGAAIEVA